MSASPQPAPSQTPLLSPGLRAAYSRSSLSRAGRRAAVPYLLASWHLLSLDAPTVAALWVFFIARSAAVALPWTEPATMFLAVWILYAADRLLDVRGLRSAELRRGLEQRHRFHHRHRVGFGIALAIAVPIFLAMLGYTRSPGIELDALLGSLLLTWLLAVHLRSSSAPHRRLPKELAVGIFFPAAIFIPTVSRVPALRAALLPDALLLAAVCSLNCLFIFAWEHPHSRRHAHASTSWAVQRLPQLTLATITAALVVAMLFLAPSVCPGSSKLLALPALACAASASLLLLLHRFRVQLSPVSLRAAADLCLLTPTMLLPILCLGH